MTEMTVEREAGTSVEPHTIDVGVQYSDGTDEIEGLDEHLREVASSLQSWVNDQRQNAGPLDRPAFEEDSEDAMSDCIEPAGMFAAYAECAAALDGWYAGGRAGPRPPGRLRRLEPPELGPVTRALALPFYLTVHDPDGRPKPLRKRDEF